MIDMIFCIWQLNFSNSSTKNAAQRMQAEPVKLVDIYTSFIWISRYFEPGQFEIELPADKELFSLLVSNEIIVTREDRETVMYVEKIKLITSTEDGDKLYISGRSAECLLERRIINTRMNFDDTVPEVLVNYLVQRQFCSPAAATSDSSESKMRKFPGLEIRPNNEYSSGRITAGYFGENVLDTVVSVCRAAGTGMRITFDSTDKTFVFETYRGQDRTDSVVFSPAFGTLISTEYERDISGEFTDIYCCESKETDGKVTDTVINVMKGEKPWKIADGKPVTEKRTYTLTGWKRGSYYFREALYGTAVVYVSYDADNKIAVLKYSGQTEELSDNYGYLYYTSVINEEYVPVRNTLVTSGISGGDIRLTIAFYNADKEYISIIPAAESGEATDVPGDAAYARFGIRVKAEKTGEVRLSPGDFDTFRVTTDYELTHEELVTPENTDISAAKGFFRRERQITAQNIPVTGTRETGIEWKEEPDGSRDSGRYMYFKNKISVKNTGIFRIEFSESANFKNASANLFFYDSGGVNVGSVSAAGGLTSASTLEFRFSVPANAVKVSGNIYMNSFPTYKIYPENIASSSITTERTLSDIERQVIMHGQALHELGSQEINETFFGEAVDNGSYKYGTDYNLGDIVRVENAYGISAAARVTEISEKEDGSGYSLMPALSEIIIEK